MTSIDEQIAAGAAPDAFIALLLGAHTRLQRGESRLIDGAAGVAATPASSQSSDDTVLFAALGWIALQRRLESWIAHCVAESERFDPPQRAPRTPPAAGLLR